MAFNGSGTFVRLYNWVSDAAAGINIRADRSDAELDGFATGLSDCVTRDGQSPPTANLPMGGFRHTGAQDGTALTDYATVGQAQTGAPAWIASGGAADAITATYVPAIPALTDGLRLNFRATAANATSAPTFAPNGLTAHPITKNGGSVLALGEIPGNLAECVVRYNLANTRWELLNPSPARFGTFVPTISFGGAAVGVTYTTQTGRYQITGNRVEFQLLLLLSSKGSSPGNIKIILPPGFPSSNVSNVVAPFSVALDGMSSLSGHIQAFSLTGATDISLQQLGTGTAASLADTNCTNTSQFIIGGSYERG